MSYTVCWMAERPLIMACCRSAAKEAAAGDSCRRVTFYEIDQLIYNTLKVPFYHLDLIGIQRVWLHYSPCSLTYTQTSKMYPIM